MAKTNSAIHHSLQLSVTYVETPVDYENDTHKQPYTIIWRLILNNKKSGVALTQLSLTLHLVEEYFINNITFIFNLYFICFVVDELPAFINIDYNFLN